MDALYQKQILEFAQHSRTKAFDRNAPLTASCDNPVCGDRVDLSLEIDNGKISTIGVTVRGCALCEAGAGFVLHALDGKTPADAHALSDAFTAWITKETDQPDDDNMAKFMPVRDIRNRHKCVLLAFQTALKALDYKS